MNPPTILTAAPLALALALLTGCGGPTATGDTQGVPRDQLALVHVRQHGCLHEWNGQAVHIDAFSIGGVEYRLSGDRDFLVTAGKHTFTVDYGPCVHGLSRFSDPTEGGIFAGPYGRFEAAVDPGVEYVLTGGEKLAGTSAVETVHALVPVRVGSTPATRP